MLRCFAPFYLPVTCKGAGVAVEDLKLLKLKTYEFGHDAFLKPRHWTDHHVSRPKGLSKPQ